LKQLYSIGIYIASIVIKLLALFNTKLKQGVSGRRETFKTLKNAIKPSDKTFWFHCASLGEYEQGLPVFEALKNKHPNYKIVLSFFSPSGFEIRKNTEVADAVVYLPLDTKSNAKCFLDIVNPDYSRFVKYEIWPNFLREIKKRDLNLILISAVFREEQSFFKWYGGFMKSSLFAFNHIFTQDEVSKKLLESINYNAVSVSGDTRFDRVSNQLNIDNSVSFIEEFTANTTTIVFGSTWPEDDKLYLDFINKNSNSDIKFIIAPHNVSSSYTNSLKTELNLKSISYSNMLDENLADYNVFILDTIGYLSKVYSYANIAFVGGGSGKTGLHNVLEPAVFGIPILIGKNYEKFPEAKALIKIGGVIPVSSTQEFESYINPLLNDKVLRIAKGSINSVYIEKSKGAVIQILDYIRI
jgi:3-deoxy-D-manno-octulosonic-acid transferase